MTTNEHSGEPANVRQPHGATVRLVFAGVAANSLTQFAIQAFMSYRFARDVWVIPQALCVAVIAALDLFAVMFMVFTYLLRAAKWWTQLYVWFVFAAGVGAQLFAAELYGAHEGWSEPVRVFAALPALFLAASLHGLIIWRNHSALSVEPTAPKAVAVERAAIKAERPQFNRQHNPDLPKRRAENAAPPLATSVRRTERKARAVESGTTGPMPVSRKSNPSRDDAVRRVNAGEATDVVATDLGVTRRAVQIWVQKAQEVQVGESVAPQVNGHEFTPGAATEARVN